MRTDQLDALVVRPLPLAIITHGTLTTIAESAATLMLMP